MSSDSHRAIITTPYQGNGSPTALSEQGVRGTAGPSRDTLGHMMTFLGLADLEAVATVHRTWNDALRYAPCVKLRARSARNRHSILRPPSVEIVYRCTLVHLNRSAFARHIYLLDHSPRVSINDLASQVCHMTNLAKIHCTLDDAVAHPVVRLPLNLTLLTVTFEQQRNFAEFTVTANRTLASIGTLNHLTYLGLQLNTLGKIDLSPLQSVKTLTSLAMHLMHDTDLMPAHVHQLRSLPWLKTIMLNCISASSLCALLETPHALQWQYIGPQHDYRWVRSQEFIETRLSTLAFLPSQTTLSVTECRDVLFLRALVNLQSISLDVSDASNEWLVSAHDLVGALESCLQISTMALTAPVQSIHMQQIVQRLSSLTDLRLYMASELESLIFLAHKPLQASLRILIFRDCKLIPYQAAQLEYIHACTHLTSLSLRDTFAWKMDDVLIDMHHPPTRLLPALETFTYEWE